MVLDLFYNISFLKVFDQIKTNYNHPKMSDSEEVYLDLFCADGDDSESDLDSNISKKLNPSSRSSNGFENNDTNVE